MDPESKGLHRALVKFSAFSVTVTEDCYKSAVTVPVLLMRKLDSVK